METAEEHGRIAKVIASGAENIVMEINRYHHAARAAEEEQIVQAAATAIIQTAEAQDGKIQEHAEIAEHVKLIATDATTQAKHNV